MEHLPEPPQGYKWESIPTLTDEFNGTFIDTDKWRDHHPYWNGREPSQFDPKNVWVKDGLFHLRSTTDVANLSKIADPEKDIWVRSACVSSQEPEVFYGYYETRMKASQLSMTSSFGSRANIVKSMLWNSWVRPKTILSAAVIGL